MKPVGPDNGGAGREVLHQAGIWLQLKTLLL